MKTKLYKFRAVLIITLANLLISSSIFAQSPEKMSYQAVIRDASDVLITNTQVGMQISILQGSESGTVLYAETQTPTTNANGLVSVEIGTGTTTDYFSAIDWANGPYFIKTETDPAGGQTYTITGTSQLLSVPYALHAKTAETVENVTVDYGDVTNTPDLSNFDQDASDDFDGDYNNLTNTPDLSGYLTSEVDGSVTNEIQDLQLVGNILTITNNGTATDIDLSAYLDNTDTQLSDAEIATMGYIKNADDADADATNEIQDLQLVGNILTITNNGTATDIDLSAYLDNTDTQLSDADITALGYIKSADDADADATNEIQTLSLSGNDLTISGTGGNAVTLPVANGSETKVTAGTNVTVTGAGTTASPYVVNASGGGSGSHYLGEEYLGGIIFYLYTDNTGAQKGLIVSKTETTATWSGSTLVNANKTSNGAYNMTLMPTGAGTARTWVETLGAGWYLPSIDELSLLWHNRFHVNNSAASGLTLLSTTALYWSSTEYGATGAFFFYFFFGYSDYLDKTGTYSVRAVRAF